MGKEGVTEDVENRMPHSQSAKKTIPQDSLAKQMHTDFNLILPKDWVTSHSQMELTFVAGC